MTLFIYVATEVSMRWGGGGVRAAGPATTNVHFLLDDNFLVALVRALLFRPCSVTLDSIRNQSKWSKLYKLCKQTRQNGSSPQFSWNRTGPQCTVPSVLEDQGRLPSRKKKQADAELGSRSIYGLEARNWPPEVGTTEMGLQGDSSGARRVR